MICFPNAKINLGLHVVSRRPDGYHNLETIFYPVGLKDALEIVPGASSNEYRLFQTGIPVEGTAEENLVIRALRLISAAKQIPPVDIHLLKKIPTGAGLGGGSSDAAFMLRLLNDTFALGYTHNDLLRLATQLGADCSFFIKNRSSFATGTGDVLEPVTVDLSGYFILLVKPDIAVSTKEAYAMITPRQPEVSLKEIVQKPVSEWKEWMKNDFEVPVFKKYPEICVIKQQMYDLGAVYAAMSGSGSAVFGVFDQEPEWQPLFSRYFVWAGSAEQSHEK
ncbi:MAG: 4-(cytidine 5'-diphospho)-2-C-methyl-D-erythritol kinase [Porphyromonadaceae bacterium]|nr:4-(cytidine 5'-diphospho)-2-C-methyl-D-erythritol kinase [Porphyromonadaceae bacterium]